MLREEADGRLVLTYDSSRLFWCLVTLAAGMLILLGYEYSRPASSRDAVIGLLVGSGAFLLAAVALREDTHVVVDPRRRTVSWKRTWAFRRRIGSLPFEEVAAVLPERPIGDDGIPSRRIVLRTKDGRTIPLMIAYRPDGRGEILRASERIRAAIEGPTGETTRAAVKALAAAGRLIDAVALLREKEGLSLAEARRQVDLLSSKP